MTEKYPIDLAAIRETAESAAMTAGEFVRRMRVQGPIDIQFKGLRNLVTEADLGAEKLILEHIRSRFPEHSILSEETSPALAENAEYLGPLWIIDPVDGTTNFAQGLFQVGVSIAFAYEGKVQAGVVYAPFLGELFSAIRGQGALCNGKPIFVSDKSDFESCLIGTGFPYDRSDVSSVVSRFDRVLRRCRDLRRLGAASLDICWVACGRLDGFYESLAPWDMAAACLIAREAGAHIGHTAERDKDEVLPLEFDGRELILSGSKIFQEFRRIVCGPEVGGEPHYGQ
jgi:myo-inositol-1(or 4)-monophosphatase